MSESSEKGVSLEDFVAKVLKKKLGARVQRDKRSGAGSHQKMDINDYFQDTRLDVEVKNHKTVAIKEWMRQAKGGASLGRVPTVVFKADDDVLACIPFTDLVDLLVEVQQGNVEIKRLREPIVKTAEGTPVDVSALKPSAVKGSWSECRGGNVVSPGSKKCLVKTCQYCSNKKVKKAK
jgi:hypothetical protein